jgi:hypothetical protein
MMNGMFSTTTSGAVAHEPTLYPRISPRVIPNAGSAPSDFSCSSDIDDLQILSTPFHLAFYRCIDCSTPSSRQIDHSVIARIRSISDSRLRLASDLGFGAACKTTPCAKPRPDHNSLPTTLSIAIEYDTSQAAQASASTSLRPSLGRSVPTSESMCAPASSPQAKAKCGLISPPRPLEMHTARPTFTISGAQPQKATSLRPVRTNGIDM